jgi:hypothetical protein
MDTQDEFNPTFKDPREAFEQAIRDKRLSRDPGAPNYAGNFMYMGTWDNKDQFKNIIDRRYID